MRHALGLFLATLLAAGAAPAQPPAVQGVCADDVARLCGDVERGAGRVLRCLRKNYGSVSPACRQTLAGMAHRGGMGQGQGPGPRFPMSACRADARTHCPDVKAGQGRIKACLRAHIDAVTEECKIALMSEPTPRPTAVPTPAPPPPTASRSSSGGLTAQAPRWAAMTSGGA